MSALAQNRPRRGSQNQHRPIRRGSAAPDPPTGSAHFRARARARTHTHSHTYTHTPTHSHTHACTCARTHTHIRPETRAQPCPYRGVRLQLRPKAGGEAAGGSLVETGRSVLNPRGSGKNFQT